MTIESLLLHGEENAITTADLVEITGATSARHLQKLIERERARGALILSAADGGYFLPDEGEKGMRELAAFVTTLRRRAENTLLTLQAANKALKQMDGAQMEIYDLFSAESEREILQNEGERQ